MILSSIEAVGSGYVSMTNGCPRNGWSITSENATDGHVGGGMWRSPFPSELCWGRCFKSIERKEMQINLAEREEIRELGSGGFGQTTLYEDAQRRRFVLKTFNPKGSNNSPKALALFKSECDRLKEVGSHNQIPSYLGFEESQGKYAIAQQYIPGRSLRQLLDEEGMFSPIQALKLLEQLLDPLAHLHQNKIIHRDIKPDNIIISLDSNLPVIVDFGAGEVGL